MWDIAAIGERWGFWGFWLRHLYIPKGTSKFTPRIHRLPYHSRHVLLHTLGCFCQIAIHGGFPFCWYPQKAAPIFVYSWSSAAAFESSRCIIINYHNWALSSTCVKWILLLLLYLLLKIPSLFAFSVGYLFPLLHMD